MSTLSCVEVNDLMEAHADGRLPASQRGAVDVHVAHCESCGHASVAVRALRRERKAAPLQPRPEVFERAMRAATGRAQEPRGVQCAERAERPARTERQGNGFWFGTAIGGALAASLLVGVLAFAPLDFGASPPVEGPPALTMALNETRDMNVAIESARNVASARIHITVTGAVALAGYEDRRELSWDTDLDSGVNMLSLPVRLHGTEGGTVHVAVSYEDRQETFTVNVRSGEPAARSNQTV